MESTSYRAFISKIFFLAYLLFSLSYFTQAQNEKRYIKDGDAARDAGDSHTALRLYLEAYKLNQTNASLNNKIGIQYLKSEYRHRCLPFFESAYKLDPKVDADILFHLAVAYQQNQKFAEAIPFYTQYRATLPTSSPLIKIIDRRLYECANGVEFMENPVDVRIESVGSVINSPAADFAPIISADEKIMIFTSRRAGSTGELLDENGEYFEDIYISKKVNGEWGTPKNIGANINTEGHDAGVALSANGSELFIYKDEGDIYYCKQRSDGSWSKPLPIEGSVNSRTSIENAAALSPDGNTLFFASNREGGYGGLDIYMVKMNDKGFWGKPINLGPVVNTEEDDEGPFMDFDGMTLYFSSRAHKGMGGLDIFKTYYDSTKSEWTEPINMGYPINSANNDIHFVLSGDGSHGYYASAKDEGIGKADIYMISMPPREDKQALIAKMKAMNMEVQPTVTAVEHVPVVEAVLLPITIKGVIKDAETGLPIVTSIQLTDANGELVSFVKADDNGMYSFIVHNANATQYTLSAEKDGYGFVNKTFNVPGKTTSSQEITQNLALKKLAVGNIFVLRNIYFDFDKATLKAASNKELNNLLELLQKNPAMEIEIAGHTDSKGSDEYNQVLSKKRAQAVVTWLVSKGISKDRLTYEGYGESRPLASNDDEEEGRELNRRTEFKIIKQ